MDKRFLTRLIKTYRLLPPLLIRDIKERYAGSAIGAFWTLIQPVLTILLFWLVFSRIVKVRISADTGEIPFFAFMLSGLLPWFAIQEGVTRGASSIVEKGYLIKKVLYPSELFPVSAAFSSLILHGVGFMIFLAGYFIYKGGLAMFQIPAIILLLILQMMVTVGLALLLSALSVYLRDILQMLGVIFQTLFYLTTILYPVSSIPEALRPFISLNPATWLIESYHNVILYGRPPDPVYLICLSIFSVMVLAAGIIFFRRLKSGFADVL